MLHGVDGAAVIRQSSVSKAQDLLTSLNALRSSRVATTLSRFPKIHWTVLSTLYCIIVMSFLLDSNQEVNQYLNSIQVRLICASCNEACGKGLVAHVAMCLVAFAFFDPCIGWERCQYATERLG